MKIVRNSDNGGWNGEAEFRTVKIEIRIGAEYWNADPNQVATKALQELETRWTDVLTSIADGLLALYNDSWRPDSIPLPVSKKEFLGKLSLETLDIGVGGFCAYFSDGDLFAGNVVSVSLSGEATPITMLEG